MAFNTANTITPTSANTAIHIVAKPTAASNSTSTLTHMANHTFCRAMPSVRRAMCMAVTIFEGLSSINTTSAASMAASEPSAPIATPTSARANAGASFMPSPTKASVVLFFSYRAIARECRVCRQATAVCGNHQCPHGEPHPLLLPYDRPST